jgi:hypothetical protein
VGSARPRKTAPLRRAAEPAADADLLAGLVRTTGSTLERGQRTPRAVERAARLQRVERRARGRAAAGSTISTVPTVATIPAVPTVPCAGTLAAYFAGACAADVAAVGLLAGKVWVGPALVAQSLAVRRVPDAASAARSRREDFLAEPGALAVARFRLGRDAPPVSARSAATLPTLGVSSRFTQVQPSQARQQSQRATAGDLESEHARDFVKSFVIHADLRLVISPQDAQCMPGRRGRPRDALG